MRDYVKDHLESRGESLGTRGRDCAYHAQLAEKNGEIVNAIAHHENAARAFERAAKECHDIGSLEYAEKYLQEYRAQQFRAAELRRDFPCFAKLRDLMKKLNP